MTFGVRRLSAVCGLMGLVSCSAPVPAASQPTSRGLTVGLALDPHPCVAGSNTVAAAVFIANGGNAVRYATPADGQLRVALLQKDGSSSQAEVRWLDVPGDNVNLTLPHVRWNIQLQFESRQSGACPVRIEFNPAPAAVLAGLGSALTTVVLQDPPPPPAFIPGAK